MPLVLILTSLLVPGAGALADVLGGVVYRLDLTSPDTGEIAVAMEMGDIVQPLVLELPDSYGNGLAAGLSSHVFDEKAVDGSGKELQVRRDGDTWTIDHSGEVTFSYKVKVTGYETGTAYLDSLAGSGTPWPYFPMLESDLAYLPGYAVIVRPRQIEGIVPELEMMLPPQWQQARAWADQPASFAELLNNPIYAGDLSIREQGALLLALPADAPAAAGGALEEYAGKAQALLEKSESLLGGLDLQEGQRLLLALLYRGEGDLLGDSYYPGSSFADSVVIPAGSGNDPLSDASIEATARGMVSLLLSRELEVGSETLWLREGSAWYLQDLIPYEAGLWGASLFWDRFNAHYDAYRKARAVFTGSLAESGVLGYESEEGAIVLTCGGASACASFDAELRSMQPYTVDLPSFLRNLSDMSSAPEPLTNDEILAAMTDLTGRDWSGFFRDYIVGSGEIPASSFSSLNIAESGGSNMPLSEPETNTTSSDWIILVIAVLVVFIIPFVLEPYTMRPRKPGFLERELGKDDED
ncbi:MAG: hypothetical protein C4536_02065 [Actinobacteria bacterium]|nr:MAG: hypothetical protein C4536_02065 [Actinomycetota bacterium]